MPPTTAPAAPAGPIEIKTAISIARQHVAEIFGQNTKDLLFEEVEGDNDSWTVTISMPVRQQYTKSLTGFIERDALSGGRAGLREYKTVTVLKRDGQVTEVKIRNLTAPSAGRFTE